MGQLWNREGDKQIAVCINSHHYGKIGDLAPLTEVKYHEKTWAYVVDLIKSGNWRRANEIESGAYFCGHNSMLDAWEYIGSPSRLKQQPNT